MLHIGSGGVQTNGLAVHAAGEGSKADILFTETEGSADFAPSYTRTESRDSVARRRASGRPSGGL